MISERTLVDVIGNLSSYDKELTIYATRPWSCDSKVILAYEPAEGGLPPEAKDNGYAYFLEVFLVVEVLDGWLQSQRQLPSAREQCERVIHYKLFDA
jgi:hypothetical protein